MNIGIIITRIGGMDGVSYETEKWIEILQQSGHTINILTGLLEDTKFLTLSSDIITVNPLISIYDPTCKKEQELAFNRTLSKSNELFDLIETNSSIILDVISDWFEEKNIELLIAENTVSLPSHISLGLAIHSATLEFDIPVICHHHDLIWDKGHRFISDNHDVNHFIKGIFPMHHDNAWHACINTHAKAQIKNKLNANAYYIPNVENFDVPFGERTANSIELRNLLGIKYDDIALFQVTKIARRKGIETAIELIKRLNDKKVKLVITGTYTDDERKNYYDELIKMVEAEKLQSQIIFAYDITKDFSLSDIYGAADICTYFSKYEGFGNTVIEAVHAKKPIFVNDYQPVFIQDIASKGFITAMTEGNVITYDLFRQMESIIYNPALRIVISEDNYKIGKKYFSYNQLKNKLTNIFNDIQQST